MLQDIRANSQGTIAKIIIGLIVISFSIFGIESLLFSGGSNAVAEVNGEEISPFDLQQELSVQQRQLLSILGDDADPSLLDEAVLSQQALETLVQREILRQAAEDMDLRTSDAVLGEMITSMEQFQLDGRFSRDLFQSSLAAAGFTPALFRDRLGNDIQLGQLRAGVIGSDFATESELAVAARVNAEARDVRYATVPVRQFTESVEVSEEAARAFYDANAEQYTSEASVDLEYLELRLDDYRQPISEQRLREEFELVRDEFELSTESRVSHILLEGDAEDNATAVAEILAALDAGTPFAELAEARSVDFGSASSGGDLGFTAGDAFPEEMEAAIAELEVGEVSGAVETDAGTHIILVTDRREGTQVPFESVRAELEERIQRGEASAELLLDVERLRDIAFNAADLEDPAEELGLETLAAEGVTRLSGPGPFFEARLREAAFSSDVLEQGHNSEVIEVDPEYYVVLRVRDRHPAAPLAFEEVQDDISADLREAAARDEARAAAQAILDAVSGGVSMEEAAREAGVEWQVEFGARRSSASLPPAVRDELFSLTPPEEGGSSRLALVDSAGGAAFYALEFMGREEGRMETLSESERALLQRRVAGETGGILQQQFETALRSRADVVVY
ncbi:MAG: SurA N-terminal domain-containing protein [Halieaceae bacterium]|jgi:peptidyl-prolyl cis-trans isomerase D|nr:SurA N-terminal domain-containing protein [Halieaceae bacterium]